MPRPALSLPGRPRRRHLMRRAAIVCLLLPVLPPAAALAETLPLRKVILSTSGLAHFEHSGQVTGSTSLDLPVRLDQVDDLLKSLVVFDPSGRIGGVSVPGRQPLEEAFRDLPFTQDDLNDPVALMNALQGAEVIVRGTTELRGRLVRVTPYQETAPETGATVTRHRITVMTESGLRSAPFEGLDSIQFTEPAVQDQIDRGLAALYQNRVRDQRTLSVGLTGGDTREVALAYVVSAPLWKAAYRLVIPAAPDQQGLLQGWAVLENQTGNDWNDVELVLVAGNPVTFRQSLYDSYYASRPMLPVEVLGRVTPRVDSGNIGSVPQMEPEMAAVDDHGGAMPMAAAAAPTPGGLMALQEAFDGEDRSRKLAAVMPGDLARDQFNMQQIAGTQATASEDATTQVLFRFPTPFSVQSGHSLMVPFVSQSLDLERVALYQPDTHPDHPLSSVHLTNTSEGGFPPGILTLYEETAGGGTAFVGDAQVPVLPKGDSRYISYALDAKTRIDRQNDGAQRITQAAVVDGTLRLSVQFTDTTTYTIRAPAEEDRVVLLEHPRQGGWEITQPKGDDVTVTKTHYRIRVPVKAGEVRPVAITLERTDTQIQGLVGMSVADLVYQSNNAGRLNPQLRAAFEDMAALRRQVESLQRQITERENERERIFRDQSRLRDNLSRVPAGSDLGRRYLTRMDEQETEIESIDTQVASLREAMVEAEAALRRYIGDLRL